MISPIRPIRLIRALALALALAHCSTSFAVDRITATVTVTNTAANLNTITVNSTARTWKTSVSAPSTEIQTASTPGDTATNLWNHLLSAPFVPSLTYSFSSTNVISMLGAVGGSLTVTTVGTWATVSYSTQVVSELSTIRVPGSALPAAIRTNEFSLLVTALDAYATTSFAETATALANFLSLTAAQTGGNKTFTNSTWDGGYLTNAEMAVLAAKYYPTNGGVWYHNNVGTRKYAIAPGIGGQPSIYDIQADTSIAEATAANYNPQPSAILNFRIATNAFGQLNNYNAWTHTNTFYQITNTPIKGSTITESTYSGTILALTNGLITGAGLTNSTLTNTTFVATNTWNGDLSFTRANNSTLANGPNSALDFGTAVYVKLKAGPTAAFSIAGINSGPRDGRLLIIDNATSQNCTFANESGLEATAANRIETGTSADIASSGNAVFILIYDSENSRWKIISPFEGGAGGSGGGTGYATIDEEAGALTQRAILNFVGAGITATDNSGSVRTDVTVDADLNAIAGLSGTGIAARTASDTWTTRTITAGTGISVADGSGAAGNPTITQTANTVVQKVEVTKNSGAVVSTRKQINFLEGSNVTLTIADDSGNDQVDITIASSAGSASYATVKEEGTSLTQRSTVNFVGAAITAVDNSGSARTDVTLSQSPASASVVGTGRIITAGTGLTGTGDLSADRTLAFDYSKVLSSDSLSASNVVFSYNGVLFEGATTNNQQTLLTVVDPTNDRTISLPDASGTVAVTATAPAAISAAGNVSVSGIVNADIASGAAIAQSKLALATDLLGVEGLSSTGIATRTATDTWTTRTITAGTGGISIANGSGVAGNPTVSLSDNGSIQKVEVTKNSGGVVSTRKQLNFIEGAGATLTIADDAVNGQVDITVAANGGITSINGLNPATQTLNSGTSGTDFAIASSGSAHTFNLPTASASFRGALSTTDWSTFANKIGGSGTAGRVPVFSASGTLTDSSIQASASLIQPSGTVDLGSSGNPFHQLYVGGLGIYISGVQVLSGTGSPESLVPANKGSLFLRTDGGAGTTMYVKESGSSTTGWVAK